MTISLDTSVAREEDGAGLGTGADFDDCSCGETFDWLRGVGQMPGPSNALLAKVIEREIIPRLYVAHLSRPTSGETAEERSPGGGIPDSNRFADFVLTSGTSDVMQEVQGLIDRGISLQRIYLGLLAPVARRLGELWEADRCTFADVTIGLARLQQVLREVGRRNGHGMGPGDAKRRIYLVPAPGEQHTFGLSMVEECFLHAGWETAMDHAHSAENILKTVSAESLDLVGFSIGSEAYFGPLQELIAKVQRAARNRKMAILVGGKFVIDHPEIASSTPSVTFVSDGVTAVDVAQNLLSQERGFAPVQT